MLESDRSALQSDPEGHIHSSKIAAEDHKSCHQTKTLPFLYRRATERIQAHAYPTARITSVGLGNALKSLGLLPGEYNVVVSELIGMGALAYDPASREYEILPDREGLK